jgi:hypothetical protein
MTQILNPQIWRFDEYALPCKCCSPAAAMENDLWICSQAHKLWYVDEKPDLSKPHSMEVCDGSCDSPLHRGAALLISRCLLVGLSLADALDLSDAIELASLSVSARAEREAKEKARLAAQAAAEAEEERLAPMLALHNAQMDVMHRHSIESRYKGNVGRKDCAPCRDLYSWQRDRKCCGTNHISSECWSHEFTDGLTSEFVRESDGALLPLAAEHNIRKALTDKKACIVRKNGKFVLMWTPHICWMLHPGEQGWLNEWETNRRFKTQTNNRFAHLGAAPQRSNGPFPHRSPMNHQNRSAPQQQFRPVQQQPKPAPKPAPKPPQSKNVFAALDSDSD